MDRADYSAIRDWVLDLLGTESSSADNTLLARLQRRAALRLERIWQHAFWPEVMETERRLFAQAWAAGNYSAGDIRYYYPEGKYYQALQSVTGQLPTDTVYWTEWKAEYTGDYWATGTDYAVGDVVQHPETDAWHQCITGHTAGATFDAAKFCALNERLNVVPLTQTGQTVIGRVAEVWDKDPRRNEDARECAWYQDADGILVDEEVDEAWLVFRNLTPKLKGAAFSLTAIYTAGQQVLYTHSDGTLNFWDCVTATSAGQTPETHAAKWSLVEIPRRFSDYLVAAIYADLLQGDGQNDKKRAAEQDAETELARTMMRFKGQQASKTRVRR